MSSESSAEAMSERELEQIEKRAEAATEGEWWVTLGSGDNLCTAIHAEDESGNMTFIADFLPDWALETAERNHVPNMEFCLHARQDIPNLLSEVRRLQSEASEAAELREENEKLDKQNTDLIQRLDDCSRVADGGLKIQARQKQELAELRERVEKLEGALEFYGDEENWLHYHDSGVFKSGPFKGEPWTSSEQPAHDGGKCARDALSQASAQAKLETRSEEELEPGG